MIRRYSELRQLETFEERFLYLKLHGRVGIETFGFDRQIGQVFYKSYEWQQVRDYVIVRDYGCDLGIEGYEIYEGLLVHHMNPLDLEAIKRGDSSILDSEYLITTTHTTHNAIHYGDERQLPHPLVERRPDDTIFWERTYDD